MATTTYHETYTNKHYQSQIPHFVGTKNTNSKRIPKFSKGCCSNVTKENLNMQNSSKENCHHDNYILHRYLNSKYQQEKGNFIIIYFNIVTNIKVIQKCCLLHENVFLKYN